MEPVLERGAEEGGSYELFTDEEFEQLLVLLNEGIATKQFKQ